MATSTDDKAPAAAIPSDDPKTVAMEAAMRAEGVSISEAAPVDYFGFDEQLTFKLPDGVSTITHKVLTEGDRVEYQKKVNRDVRFQKGSGDAVMRLSPGEEKHALLEKAIIGWSLVRAGQPLQFTKPNLQEFLKKAPPKIVDFIEKEIRKANPWLLAEMTVEDIDREIESLTEMRATLVAEQEGKADS